MKLADQVEEKRTQAEKDIMTILNGFMAETGFTPTGVQIETVDASTNGEPRKRVITELFLHLRT